MIRGEGTPAVVGFQKSAPHRVVAVSVMDSYCGEHDIEVQQVVAQAAQVEVYGANFSVAEDEVVGLEVAVDVAEDVLAFSQDS